MFPAMKYASMIVHRFGGIRPMARILGVSPAVIQYWQKVGHVPAKRHAAIMKAAKVRGIKLRPADFFDLPA